MRHQVEQSVSQYVSNNHIGAKMGDHFQSFEEEFGIGISYTPEEWEARLWGFWAPFFDGYRAETEIFPPKPRLPVNPVASREAIARAGGQCERCEQIRLAFQLELHHLHYRTIGKESKWDLLALCRECHKKQHIGLDGYWWNDTEQLAAWEWEIKEVMSKND